MKKYVLFIVFVVSMVGGVKMQGNPGVKTDKDEEVKKEIIKLEDERDQALMHNDADWFERVFADDIAYMGGTVSKAKIVGEIRSKERTWQAVRHDHYNVRVYGTTAVVTYLSHSTMVYKGAVSNNVGITTDVYVKKDGKWLAVVHAGTPVPK